MNSLKVTDIIKSVKACITDEYSCVDCLFIKCDKKQNCQQLLAQAVEDKFNELVNLLDDKVNHHYYDTLESLQEENSDLRSRMEQIQELIQHS